MAKPNVPVTAAGLSGSRLPRTRPVAASESASLADRARASSSARAARPEPRAISVALLLSAQRAAKAFENFRLSKFAKNEVPGNYVHPEQVRDRKAVQDTQRKSITAQLRKLPKTDPRNAGVTITFPTAKLDEVRKHLPGVSENGGEVKLDALLAYLGARMNGRKFYARGNSTLQRLTTSLAARAQAKAMIERVKKGPPHAHLATKKGGSKP